MEIITFETNLTQPQHALYVLDASLKSILNEKNIYIVGDLHGNFVKLISALIHFEFITYKQNENHIYAQIFYYYDIFYQDKVPNGLYDDLPKSINYFMDDNFSLSNEIILNKKLIFTGDILCDRGPSDFMTLIIFNWMKKNKIQYSSMIGNHEFSICQGRAFSDNPNYFFASLESQGHPCYRSFDYFKLTSVSRGYFKKLFLEYLEHCVLLKVLFQNKNILITHAPCTYEQFSKLSAFCEKHLKNNDVWNDEFNDFIRKKFLMYSNLSCDTLSNDQIDFFECIGNFCSHRFVSHPLFANAEDGINIFGHMSGSVYIKGSQKKIFSSSQICLDRSTGKPNCLSGQIAYIKILS